MTAASCACLALLKLIIKKITFGVYYGRLERYTDKDVRIAKADKASINTFKFFYYTSATIFGWYFVLRHLEYLPPMMFGNGDITLLYKDFPLKNNPPAFMIYYHIEFGFHLLAFLSHLFSEPRNDFMEMHLHHTLTLFLIYCSLMSGHSNNGVLVLFLHNWGDIFSGIVRTIMDLVGSKVLLPFYFLLLASWIYGRIVCYTFIVIRYGSFDENIKYFRESVNTNRIQALMNITLVILHFYWIFHIARMGFLWAKKGKAEDTINQIKSDKKEDEGEPRGNQKKNQ